MSKSTETMTAYWATVVVLAYGVSVGLAQPIDPATAAGSYSGGGITLSADDVRRIARGEDAGAEFGVGSPRGVGGNVLIVECNGAFGFSTIQSAIDAAADGDVVVVLPNDCTAAGRWFENLVILDKAIRIQSANPADVALVDATIVDGSASGSVVRVEGAESSGTIIDGLTLTNGHGPNSSVGGGLTCYFAAPTIRRCAIRENASVFGGGLRVISLESPRVESCRFIDNAAIPSNGNGSAVAASQSAFPLFTDCTFSGHGGVVVWLSAVAPGSCASATNCATFEDCRFEENDCLTVVRGDALVFLECEFLGNTGSLLTGAGIEFSNCRFEENDAGGAKLLDVTDGLRMTDCEVVGNIASNLLQISGALFEVKRCYFRENVASLVIQSSGDIASQILECEFVGNESGGAMIASAGGVNLRIERCAFRQNRGLWTILMGNTVLNTLINRCEFRQNDGGAILLSIGEIRESLFIGNRTSFTTLIHTTSVDVLGCTFVGNRGAVRASSVQNSIIYNNRGGNPDDVRNQVFRANVSYSNVQSLSPSSLPPDTTRDSPGNIALEPRFVDPGYWDDMGTPEDLSDDVFIAGDYHLLPDSPCIDSGDPAFVAGIGAMDIDDEARVMSCRVDMGVDEFTQDDVNVVGDFDGDGDLTVDDLPAFLSVTLDPLGIGVCRADVNGDGLVDGRDVAAMVGLLLGQ